MVHFKLSEIIHTIRVYAIDADLDCMYSSTHVIGPRGRDCNSWSTISSVLSAIVEIVDYRNYHHLLRLSFSFQLI